MFVVVSVATIPDHLRGYTGRFLQQAGPGLYVGKVSGRVADALWEKLVTYSGSGCIAMVISTANDIGFELRLHQVPGIEVADFDGLVLPVETGRNV